MAGGDSMKKSLVKDFEAQQHPNPSGKAAKVKVQKKRCLVLPVICGLLALLLVSAGSFMLYKTMQHQHHKEHHKHSHHHNIYSNSDSSAHHNDESSSSEIGGDSSSAQDNWQGGEEVVNIEEEIIFYEEVTVKVDDKCSMPVSQRMDCYPGGGSTQDNCVARGCCWVPATPGRNDVPWCFYPADNDNSTYMISNLTETDFGYSAQLSRQNKTHWPEDVMALQLDVKYETNQRLHFKIYDPVNHRFEVPIETPTVGEKTDSPDYVVGFGESTFDMKVTRKDKLSSALFDTNGTRLTFADQYIEISTSLPTKYVYGFGEHRGKLLHDVEKGFSLSTWARDIPPAGCVNCNLYGQHPLFIGVEESGDAYGVFLLNSNAMEVTVTPGSPPILTYRTIGGILDFYLFTGPKPEDVVNQYLQVVGKPYMPPYWGLGYHLCRWGYGSSEKMKAVIKRMRDGGFPYDTQWNDIDYMDNHFDWTYDKDKFKDLPAVVDDLHAQGQHYIMIVDPGIRNQTGYPTFDDGLKDGVFITKSGTTDPIIGVVWPGQTAFPDFFNPATQKWWTDQARGYYQNVKFDGLWTDMNEPSNFGTGSVEGCTNSKYDNPPFTPGIVGGSLLQKTLCPSSQHKNGLHYNLHSMYGHSELIASTMALHELRPSKRTVVISRSTFPSSGKYAGHWTGDNDSSWDDLRFSIAGILNFQFFGIPFLGADICGFMGTTNGELCVRWTQLGAYYPFMRNHNTLGSPDQDPGADMFKDSEKAAMKDALKIRYTLLPYLYTLLHRAHAEGATVARPLWFEYSTDANTYPIDDQFMWGESLMIAPVVKQGATSRSIYFPADTWVDFVNYEVTKSNGSMMNIDAPLTKIPVYQRAGSILPVNANSVVTTTAQRKTPFSLMIALDDSGLACGSLYWDDGEKLDVLSNGSYNFIYFKVGSEGKLTNNITHAGYKTEPMTLNRVLLMNVQKPLSKATVNGVDAEILPVLNTTFAISKFTADLLSPLLIQWS